MLRNSAISALLFFALFSSQCFAAHTFYVGMGIGPEAASFQQSARIIVPLNSNVQDKTNLSGTGIFGTVFAGYAWICHQFYLAGEFNIDANGAKFSSSNEEFLRRNFNGADYRLRRAFGISLLPGFLYSPFTLFYARIGYSNVNFQLQTTEITIGNFNRSLNGVRVGFGMNQAINDHASVRLDFSQTYLDTVRRFRVDPASGATKRTHIRPELGQVGVSLIYNFA